MSEPTGTPAAERDGSLLTGIIVYLVVSAFLSGSFVGWSSKHCRPSAAANATWTDLVLMSVSFPLLMVQGFGYGIEGPPDDGHCDY